ncbi:MAG TPA: class IV adenylate cyclase [Verrucomicrobiae bacterium]|nr:class IV adenylate cyclase [Verrucomicrobiae bacterium]
MGFINVEIKARAKDHKKIRALLLERKAEAKGTDHQVDTYFIVPNGRLKLREGNIENSLIFYNRPNQEGPKLSEIVFHDFDPKENLKEVLVKALPTKVVVDKQREIYFIGNLKFHLDTVEGLGTFVEIEARDYENVIGKEKLHEQCQEYVTLFGINEKDLLATSYSDLLLEK